MLAQQVAGVHQRVSGFLKRSRQLDDDKQLCTGAIAFGDECPVNRALRLIGAVLELEGLVRSGQERVHVLPRGAAAEFDAHLHRAEVLARRCEHQPRDPTHPVANLPSRDPVGSSVA